MPNAQDPANVDDLWIGHRQGTSVGDRVLGVTTDGIEVVVVIVEDDPYRASVVVRIVDPRHTGGRPNWLELGSEWRWPRDRLKPLDPVTELGLLNWNG